MHYNAHFVSLEKLRIAHKRPQKESLDKGQSQAAGGKLEFTPPFASDAVLYLKRVKE